MLVADAAEVEEVVVDAVEVEDVGDDAVEVGGLGEDVDDDVSGSLGMIAKAALRTLDARRTREHDLLNRS